MADLLIKPLTGAGNTVTIQDQAGGAILTSGNSGATLSNATLTAPTIADMSNCTLPTVSQDSWAFGRSTNAGTSYSGAVIDFDVQNFKGSNITESAGTITIGTSGLYWINTMLTCHGTSDDFDWWLNGAKITGVKGGRFYSSDAHVYHVVQLNTLVQMGATNTIAVYGDAVNVYGTGLMSVFQGFRIGGNE
jgi:hypothetical protein